jgi:hypothetical protein
LLQPTDIHRYALFPRREFLSASFSVLLAFALFDPGVANAQQGKETSLENERGALREQTSN